MRSATHNRSIISVGVKNNVKLLGTNLDIHRMKSILDETRRQDEELDDDNSWIFADVKHSICIY